LNSYNDKVKSFPFFVFGPVDCLWVALNKAIPQQSTEENILKRIRGCFWGSGAGGTFKPPQGIEPRVAEAINFSRDATLFDTNVQKKIVCTANLNHETFLEKMRSYRSHLVLNGTGRVHRRLFEGMSQGSLAIIESNDIIYPKEIEMAWPKSSRCMVDNNKDLVVCIDNINNNDDIYSQFLTKQNVFFNTFINKTWLKNHILNNID